MSRTSWTVKLSGGRVTGVTVVSSRLFPWFIGGLRIASRSSLLS